MRLVGFSLVVASAWFVLVNATVSFVAWWLTPVVLARASALEAAARAGVLFAWRLLPSATALLVSLGVAWPSFLAHESRDAEESLRVWLVLGIAVTATLVGVGTGAAWRAWRAARVRTSAWRGLDVAAGQRTVIVETGLATAAVAGLWRPTIFVGRRLSDILTADELNAVIAHEAAHADARDNLRRALLLATPDLLRFSVRGAAVLDAWMVATEHAADDRVAAGGPAMAIDLAGALVKAARLVAVPASEPALVRSVTEHGELAGRVVRLLAPVGAPGSSRLVRRVMLGAMAAGLGVVWIVGAACAPVVHAVSEVLVNGHP